MSNTTDSATRNRRRSTRRRLRTSVKIECRRGSAGLGPNLTQSVLDLSDSGIRIIVNQELTLKGDMEVVISSYGMQSRIKRIAIVRWQVRLDDGRFCVGIEFEKRLSYRDWQTLAAPND